MGIGGSGVTGEDRVRWVRELWVEMVFVALLMSAAGAILEAAPRLKPEAVSLAVLFLSHLVVLAAATFLIVRSTVTGWWLAVLALVAVAGPRLMADGVGCVLLGASPAGLARPLAVNGGLSAAGLVLMVVLAQGWQRSRLPLKPAELVATVPVAAALTLAYALAYALAAAWAAPPPGLTSGGALAPGLPQLFAAGAARGAVMVVCAVPLLFTLLGRRIKNALGVGALLGFATVAAHLAAARSLSGEMLGGAAVQGLLSFLLGVALVRSTRPPLVERESSWEGPAVQEVNPEVQAEEP